MPSRPAGRCSRADLARRCSRRSLAGAAARAARVAPRSDRSAQERRAEEQRRRGERRLLRGVTMVQTALTLALLVGAGLLIRTMSNAGEVASGYRTDHILTMTVTAVQGDWADFHQSRARARRRRCPACRCAAFAWGVPLTGNNWPGNDRDRGAAGCAQRERADLAAAARGHARLFHAARDGDRRRPRLPIDRRPQGAARGRRQSGVGRSLLPAAATPIGKKHLDGRTRSGRRPRSSAWSPTAAPTI